MRHIYQMSYRIWQRNQGLLTIWYLCENSATQMICVGKLSHDRLGMFQDRYMIWWLPLGYNKVSQWFCKGFVNIKNRVNNFVSIWFNSLIYYTSTYYKSDALPAELTAPKRHIIIAWKWYRRRHKDAAGTRMRIGNVLVDGCLQCLARFELRNIGGGNVNFFAGPWIAARGRFPMGNTKGAETDKTDFSAILKGGSNNRRKTVDCLGSVGFGKTSLARHSGDKIIFVQWKAPSFKWWWWTRTDRRFVECEYEILRVDRKSVV